jgi:RsiW-degrading membrane proteinase PrsW (M82 family)
MSTPGDPLVTCWSCGHEVPSGNYCVRCGASLPEAAEEPPARGRREFAAAPHESQFLPAVISTLFPQLPRASMATFRVALAIGVAIVVALGLARMFPVAIVAAAVLVPLLVVIYLYDVDVYEDEPVRVIALTMVWGAAAGVIVGVIAEEISPSGVSSLLESTERKTLLRGILLPLLGGALMIAGPLVLLPYRRFNDVLDGATFGAAAAVSFVGAQLLVHSIPLFDAGIRPVGLIFPWIVRLLELAVALPLLSAGAIGAAAGALWLRYRAPVVDRAALGRLGHPLVALPLAGAFLVAAALVQLHLPRVASFAFLIVLAAVALLWLRRVIHIGLLQEAAEVPIEAEIVCANCGRSTPRHTFCARCGISLRALPKSRLAEGPAVPEATSHAGA